MPDTHTAPTRRLIHQHRPYHGPTQPIYYSIPCPTCGHRAQLGLTHTQQPDNQQPPAVTILQFRCANQATLTHRTPTNAQLLDLL